MSNKHEKVKTKNFQFYFYKYELKKKIESLKNYTQLTTKPNIILYKLI